MQAIGPDYLNGPVLDYDADGIRSLSFQTRWTPLQVLNKRYLPDESAITNEEIALCKRLTQPAEPGRKRTDRENELICNLLQEGVLKKDGDVYTLQVTAFTAEELIRFQEVVEAETTSFQAELKRHFDDMVDGLEDFVPKNRFNRNELQANAIALQSMLQAHLLKLMLEKGELAAPGLPTAADLQPEDLERIKEHPDPKQLYTPTMCVVFPPDKEESAP